MNLLENYIKEVVDEVDYTNEWNEGMKRVNPNYRPSEEKVLRVVCIENCYGRESIQEHFWKESEWEKIKKDGFYMG